ncbi:peptide deformylase [Falsarthrobacter nasiphocae]|uniref:Peptide deformylase n=1 Tax=Falsarthrobacter nasiphocae TaxID=189863 RepID=A0AAE3YGA9_9MICC|nr:peptide deformylase [Falsarthrobacter nasiphocae]MDR6891241.1 peptide deformylase [Falsarthrobacter nasiphocae]
MSILPVRLIGDPVLRETAASVSGDPARYAGLVADMFETMDAVSGVGLAAPQIGASVRIFTFDDRRGSRGVCVNPVIVERVPAESDDAGAPESVTEGCLSVPEIAGVVGRSGRVVVSYTAMDGTEATLEAEGLLAAIMEHETDHLDGRLFIDRLTGDARREAMRRVRAADYGVSGARVAQSRASSVSSAFGATATSFGAPARSAVGGGAPRGGRP